MAGEIQLNSTTMATESSGTITLSNVNSATNRTNLGLGSMATQNANAVAITGGTINTVQPATGQSLTIKDEDGNTAITVGTDNTAASYLSLNFGSYHGGSGGAGSGTLTGNTLDDYETGTYTPVFSVINTPVTATYSIQNGKYLKIGNTVFLTGDIALSSSTSPTSGSVSIGGFPFNVDGSNNANGTVNLGYVDGVSSYPIGGNMQTTARVILRTNTYSDFDLDQFTSSTRIIFSAIYKTSA